MCEARNAIDIDTAAIDIDATAAAAIQ